MDSTSLLELATATFLDRLDKATAASLSAPTPCEGWSVADLLEHVSGGCRMSVSLLEGATLDEVMASLGSAAPAEDPIAACRSALGAQASAMIAATDHAAIVHHPIGDVPVSRLFDFRIADLTLHAWDLAQGLGLGGGLPEELVEATYAGLSPMAEFIASTGMFGSGPSGEVGEDAPLELRLLDLAGRRS
jgi:uncharacterized protein (TIGR03086 family)